MILEQTRRDANEEDRPPTVPSPQAVLAAAEVLGELRESGVVVAVRAEEGELVGLLVLADDRIGDAYGPEDITLLEGLATQIGVVVENSRVYDKMKERDRLAVLGQMAAGLAHEIRNPLGAIKGAAQLLADPQPGAHTPDDTAQEIHRDHSGRGGAARQRCRVSARPRATEHPRGGADSSERSG